MRWLKKLLGREQTHEEWLAEHPDKATRTSSEPLISEEDEQRMRETMEGEMAAQREEREAGR